MTRQRAEAGTERESRRRRHEWLLFLLISLMGFCCIFSTAQLAIRLPPRWRVSADMSSRLELDVQQDEAGLVIAPVRPEIMTLPAWIDVALTPQGQPTVISEVALDPLSAPTATPRRVAVPPTPTERAMPSPRPTATSSPTPYPTPTDTATPLPSPTVTFTPLPTWTPTPRPTDVPPPPPPPPPPPAPTSTFTPSPTPTATPIPPPSVIRITPNEGLNTGTTQVVIEGANFFGVPTATLGSGVAINVSAATADTITGTVPSGLLSAVYVLTVTNPDGQSAVLAPAFVVRNPPSVNTTLETNRLVVFGRDAPQSDGDDDFVQVIFFEVPAGTADPLFVRVFDADTGGGNDEPHPNPGAWNTTVTYTLRGGAGAYSAVDARSAHPGATGINAGTLLSQTVIGDDAAYDGNWNLTLGPYQADTAGECLGGKCFLKLIVEGGPGDDGSYYNAVLSTSATAHTPPDGARTFAYSWCFLLDTPSLPNRPPIYPFVPASAAGLDQYNFDFDYDSGTMTLYKPTQVTCDVPSTGMSGNGSAASSSCAAGALEGGATWTMLMTFTSNPFTTANGNSGVVWFEVGGVAVPIFARPTLYPLP